MIKIFFLKNCILFFLYRWSSVTITITFTTSRIFQIFELFVGIICVALTILGYYYIKNYTRKSMKLA